MQSYDFMPHCAGIFGLFTPFIGTSMCIERTILEKLGDFLQKQGDFFRKQGKKREKVRWFLRNPTLPASAHQIKMTIYSALQISIKLFIA